MDCRDACDRICQAFASPVGKVVLEALEELLLRPELAVQLAAATRRRRAAEQQADNGKAR